MLFTPSLIFGIVDWATPTKLHSHLYSKNFVSLVLAHLVIPLFVMSANEANMSIYLLAILLQLVLSLLSYCTVIYGHLLFLVSLDLNII